MTNDEIKKLLEIWRSNANYEGKYPPPYTLMAVQLNNACDVIEELINKHPINDEFNIIVIGLAHAKPPEDLYIRWLIREAQNLLDLET